MGTSRAVDEELSPPILPEGALERMLLDSLRAGAEGQLDPVSIQELLKYLPDPDVVIATLKKSVTLTDTDEQAIAALYAGRQIP